MTKINGARQIQSGTVSGSGLVVASDTVSTIESTTSTSFADLATVGPAVTVTIGSGGLALVTLTALLQNTTVDQDAYMGFVAAGVAAADARTLRTRTALAGDLIQASATYLVSGLAAGTNTFTAKYKVTANTGWFMNRNLIVIPL